jgi:hypothetical protein
MTYLIIGWILTAALHTYLLARWTGRLHIVQFILGLLVPPAALLATYVVYGPISDWDGVIWRSKK